MRSPFAAQVPFSMVFGPRILSFLAAGALAATLAAQTVDPSHLGGLKWRSVGPFRGGRVSAVTGVISQPDTFYIGLPEGGVWKTTSAGQTWYPIFDAVKGVCSVGSVQVAQSDPNVVYAGTGEISGGGEGNGVYRSLDAGQTWQHVGLDESKTVPTLLVDPHDKNLVLAASLGPAGSPSPSRGIYRSTNGGSTWTKTLFIDNGTGIQHLAWAFDNPSVVYASSWQRYQPPGKDPNVYPQPAPPDLYKSTDEGVTWKKLNTTGLPKMNGRICVGVAQGTHSQRLFVIGTFGLYRSDDGGSTWRQMAADDHRIANGQGYYTSGVYVDPQNPDIVYTLATCVYRSTDGGKTFEGFKGAPGGDDPQQLWIDPSNRTHILLGGDQGATVSLDAGKTWGSWYNQPTGQVYHVSTDTQFPYWVYATQQDSGCIGTSSRGNLGAITPMDWLPHPGNEGGYIVVDPLNPKVSYAVGPIGGIMKVTYPSGQWVQVEPGMSPESGFRGFSTQMAFSPTNKHELMVGYQYLMSTTDGGVHWTKLSPDLSVDPLAKKPANPNMPMFAAINSFSASPVAPGVIWAGTSNGLVYVTKNHGKTWDDVTLSRLPSQRTGVVRCIEASPQEAGSAYLAIGGFGRTAKAHVYRTHDFGSSWSEIDKGIPQSALDEGGLVAIRADGKQAGLLFGLTGKDVLVSTDDGGSWQSLNLNLPTTSFSDLTIHENDLVLGTYGRGIWILDDYAPLRQISAKTVAESAHLFKPSTAYRLRRNVNGDTPFPPEVPHAENPPLGAIIYYSLAAKPTGEIKLEIVDAHGRVVRHLSSAPAEPYDDPAPLVPSFWIEKRKPLPTDIGLNRINWNVRFDTPPAFTHDVSDVMGAIAGDTPAAIEGPLALPGEYTVRLTVDGKVMTQPLIVKNDPRSPSTRRDLVQENTFRLNIYAGIVEAWDGYHQAVELRAAIAKVLDAKPSAEIAKAAKTLDAKLAEVAGTVYRERRFYGPPPATSFVNLNGYLLAHLDAYDYGDMAPNEAMKGAYGSDWAKLHAVTEQWRAILAKDVPAFNSLLRKGGLAAIAMPTNPLIDPPAPARQYLPPKAVGDGGGGTN